MTIHLITTIAESEAKRLARKWRLDWEDISQEIVLYAITKQYDENDYTAIDDDEEYVSAIRQLKGSLKWAGERYCRKEKAAKEGYSPQDEAFYSLGYIEELLTIYFQIGITEHAPVGVADSVRQAKSNGAETGNYLASMLDLEKGLKQMSEKFSRRLVIRLGQLGHLSDARVASLSQSEAYELTGMHPETLADLVGSTGDAVRHRTRTALVALQREMGGPSPYREAA